MFKRSFLQAGVAAALKPVTDTPEITKFLDAYEALCREHGMSSATFYKWRAKFGGMDASLMAAFFKLVVTIDRFKRPFFPLL